MPTKKQKAGYVDGFVLTIPKKKTAEYKKMAREANEVWMKFGALDYKECMIDDAKPQHVTFTFPKMARAKTSENVWVSFITFKNRNHRDAVNKKVMAHFEKKYGEGAEADMPFDMKRMAYGGFTVEVGS
jgi:uncharacterized protein YbaA (DUF1428 family)